MDTQRHENRKYLCGPVRATKFFLEVSAILDVRHCPKLQSGAISMKDNDVLKMAKISISDPI